MRLIDDCRSLRRRAVSAAAAFAGPALGLGWVGVAAAEFPRDPAPCPVRPGTARLGATPIEWIATGPGSEAGSPSSPGGMTVEAWSDDDHDLHFVRWVGVFADPVSPELPFVVDAGTVGLVIRAEEVGLGRYVSVELLDGNGELLARADCEDAAAVGEVQRGRGTVQMPSTDRPGWELEPGEYAARIRAWPADPDSTPPSRPLTVTASFRCEGSLEVERLLDLQFVFLPGSGVDASFADSSGDFATLLEGVDERLDAAGIGLGHVSFVDFDRPEFSRIGTWEEAGRMFVTTSEIGRTRTLSVFCLDGFDEPLYPAFGLSGAIPGPPYDGTRDSGIAIKISPFPTCAPVHPDGYTCLGAYTSLMVHEIGHYLGFWHTTEADLEHFDPFSDTPECDSPDLGACPDWTYTMFPVIHAANYLWSDHQARVAPTHPLLRSVPHVGGPPRPTAIGPDRPARSEARVRALPNPFGERVAIAWGGTAPDPAAARLAIWDVRGRRVRGEVTAETGWTWDGRDDSGRSVPAGLYFARVVQDGRATTVRLVKTR